MVNGGASKVSSCRISVVHEELDAAGPIMVFISPVARSDDLIMPLDYCHRGLIMVAEAECESA